MAGGLSHTEELFLNTALQNNVLTNARANMLREEKFFYPDKSVIEAAIAKGFLNSAQLETINQLMSKPPAPEPGKPGMASAAAAPTTAATPAAVVSAAPAAPVAGAVAAPASAATSARTGPAPAAGPASATPTLGAAGAAATSPGAPPAPPLPGAAPAMPRPAATQTAAAISAPSASPGAPPARSTPPTSSTTSAPLAVASQAAASSIVAAPELASFTRLAEYLAFARAKQVSDFHLSSGYPPYARRNGRFVFFDRPPLKSDEIERLVFSALTEERRQELLQNLNLECALDVDGQGRYRTTLIRHQHGWDGTFRVVNSLVPSIQELGLPESVLRLADYRQGMILVTGPGGCGKTTTMAAMVDHVNANRPDHILTLEEPIEYVIVPKKAQVNQREIGTHSESYKRALRAALREDPDVILLGEMRDLETISMAITAAETGHLIFGTLHTTTAARTITRILDSYPPSQQPMIRTMISESLRGIICQQLIPRCDCDGLALACEVLVVTPGVASLIREMKIHQVVSAVQTGKRQGMVRMEDSLMDLYNKGLISIEEACDRADDKRTFLPLLGK